MYKSGFEVVTDRLLAKATENQDTSNSFMGRDGLLYCSKCKMPIQKVIKWYDESMKTVPIICLCKKEEGERARRLEQIEKLKDASGFEAKYANSTLGSIERYPEIEWTLALCQRYIDRFDELFKENQGLMFYGNVGTGKTLLSHCIGNALIEKLYKVSYVSLAKVLTGGYKTREEEDKVMDKVYGSALLLIDDLGAERSTEYAQEFVYSILDTRCNTGKPMIVTTNLSLEYMQGCGDTKYKRIYDRILEVCYPVNFNWKSYRMKNAAMRYDSVSKLLGGGN